MTQRLRWWWGREGEGREGGRVNSRVTATSSERSSELTDKHVMELDAQAIKECRPPEKQKNNTTQHNTTAFSEVQLQRAGTWMENSVSCCLQKRQTQ